VLEITSKLQKLSPLALYSRFTWSRFTCNLFTWSKQKWLFFGRPAFIQPIRAIEKVFKKLWLAGKKPALQKATFILKWSRKPANSYLAVVPLVELDTRPLLKIRCSLFAFNLPLPKFCLCQLSPSLTRLRIDNCQHIADPKVTHIRLL